MAIPTYDLFIEPVLRFLATRTDGALSREVYEAAAVAMQLTIKHRFRRNRSLKLQPVIWMFG